jgi:hypothetical protein
MLRARVWIGPGIPNRERSLSGGIMKSFNGNEKFWRNNEMYPAFVSVTISRNSSLIYVADLASCPETGQGWHQCIIASKSVCQESSRTAILSKKILPHRPYHCTTSRRPCTDHILRVRDTAHRKNTTHRNQSLPLRRNEGTVVFSRSSRSSRSSDQHTHRSHRVVLLSIGRSRRIHMSGYLGSQARAVPFGTSPAAAPCDHKR